MIKVNSEVIQQIVIWFNCAENVHIIGSWEEYFTELTIHGCNLSQKLHCVESNSLDELVEIIIELHHQIKNKEKP